MNPRSLAIWTVQALDQIHPGDLRNQPSRWNHDPVNDTPKQTLLLAYSVDHRSLQHRSRIILCCISLGPFSDLPAGRVLCTQETDVSPNPCLDLGTHSHDRKGRPQTLLYQRAKLVSSIEFSHSAHTAAHNANPNQAGKRETVSLYGCSDAMVGGTYRRSWMRLQSFPACASSLPKVTSSQGWQTPMLYSTPSQIFSLGTKFTSPLTWPVYWSYLAYF